MPKHLLLALGIAFALAACSPSNDADEDFAPYFTALESELQLMETDLTALERASAGLRGEALAANREAHGAKLRSAADAVEAIEPPSDPRVEEAHRMLVVAMRDVADISDREASLARGAGGLTAEDISAQGLARVADWYGACHTLQDRALALEIDADLRCVTAFGG